MINHHMIDSRVPSTSPRMFVKICSVSRSPLFRQSRLSMATLARMSNPSAAPGPMETSISDKVSLRCDMHSLFLISLQAHPPLPTLGARDFQRFVATQTSCRYEGQ